TPSELATAAGAGLLYLCRQIAAGGMLNSNDVVRLRSWLRVNQPNESVAAIAYLSGITKRITAAGEVDRAKRLELQLAIEKIIPPAQRTFAIQARKKREAERREQLRHHKKVERIEQQRIRQEERARQREEQRAETK